jgi:meiotically up-regulated gene 157 (Mug157) protein
VFVATGDIDDMWIRDSSVQLATYFPRMASRPALKRVLEGAMRTQAFYITQDPYANAYGEAWRDAAKLSKADRVIGRGGWVSTRNYELDSGAYFLNMLWNYYATPGVRAPSQFLNESQIFDAAALLVDVWTREQKHESLSPYRYSELPRGGLGPETAFTGMTWSGYRPSDDPQTYGYNVPVNMYAAGALERALEINAKVWKCPKFAAAAAKLAGEIRAGIDTHGVVTHEDGTKSYAYEVDGLGNALADFDDPNVPSLLSIPLLGYPHYDPAMYATTRARVLSTKNDWFFEGPVLTGLGSPHTPPGYVWPLAVMVDALTTADAGARVAALRALLRAQCGNGLMHESVSATDASACTREWFEWANAMFTVLYEDTFKERCDAAADEHRLEVIKVREGVGSDPLHYETLEAQIRYLP